VIQGKVRAALAAGSCAALVLGGCSPAQRVAVHSSPQAQSSRVISLAPSLTEIAFAIGCRDQLVADTAYDDYPAAAKQLPHVADLAHADLERIAALSPTVVVALHDQEHEAAPISERLGVAVIYLPNRRLNDLYADIVGVAAACGRPAQGAALVQQMREKIDGIAAHSATRAPRPRVLYLLGLPGFTAGGTSYINDLITIAGGDNVAAASAAPYPDLSAEAIVKADPDVIIVSNDTPFGPDMRSREPWRSLRAVRTGHVVRPPDDSILERNGPRVVQGLAWLADQFGR
jgi:iron complex transport system substrate-binding protein